ncbi:acylneuraminate cytidylyltransferase family protein [Gillisia sp. Hel1_33_143]|uniref:acylneuraminate cytidylyltransferase family protein n=1 Tax=Gillisia sp. Hel1_33_143 TaxID=1336796 RepID=UPI002936DDF3|nr:acylneuraminate cytidylyltransferase family protein [Gillisia sp. Hel1_33_143]
MPARGGSKRLPGKNIKLLDGLPLIVHSINFAKENLGIIDKIVVSTDHDEIKKIAKTNGAEVIDRPLELAQDLTSTLEVLHHIMDELDEQYDNVILLQPTNPLRPQHLLENAYSDYLKGNFNSLMTVTRNHQKFGKIKDSRFVPFNYKMGERSQDLEPLYFENGLLYIVKAEIIKNGELLAPNNCAYVIDHLWAKVDIDTLDDFEYAEFLMKKENRK